MITIIEVEAETLEKARAEVQSKVSEGFFLFSEKVISDGKPQKVEATENTILSAFMKAQNTIPTNATVVAKNEIVMPGQKTIQVEAWDEDGAQLEAKRRIGETATIVHINLLSMGKKGFLGIGKKPNQYEIEIFQKASVEIIYKTKAKILAKISQEDPAIYGEEFVELRALLEKQNGVLNCLQCNSDLLIDLNSIENDIRQNQAITKIKTNVHFATDISNGTVCKQCKGVVCGKCTQESLNKKKEQREQLKPLVRAAVVEAMGFQDFLRLRLAGNDVDQYVNEALEPCLSPSDHSTILCPKCKQSLLRGIDHFTD